MFSSNRPPFIVGMMADTQGCGFYRMQLPMGSLVSASMVTGRLMVQPYTPDVMTIVKPDIIVWQRMISDDQLKLMRDYRKLLPDTYFVYELDDYMGEIPAASFHSGFMPPNMGAKIALTMAECQAVTTTTGPLADWLRELGATNVHVVPNGVPLERLRDRKAVTGRKLRVGWAGGLSHGGDLMLLQHAMKNIGDEVEWVFLGMKPEITPVRIEFHDGTPPAAYMDALEKLDVDLFLAPLEDNRFNRCKSSLRIVEAGALNTPVIAQQLEPYIHDKPPVFGYAKNPEDWTFEIRRFMNATPEMRQRSANALRAWVSKSYTLEALLKKRIEGWFPPQEKHWKPRAKIETTEEFVISAPGGRAAVQLPHELRHVHVAKTLTEACERAASRGSSVLWVRPGTDLDSSTWARFRGTNLMDPTQFGRPLATLSVLASDGQNAFPKKDSFTPVTPETAQTIRDILHSMYAGRNVLVPAPGGPCMLLNRHALAMLGAPDVDGCDGNEEAAILEWSLAAVAKGWLHIQAVDAYVHTLAPPQSVNTTYRTRLEGRGLTSFLQPIPDGLANDERLDVELKMLYKHWTGPQPGMLGFPTDYATWSIMRGDPEPESAESIQRKHMPAVVSYGSPKPDSEWIIYVDDHVTLRPSAQAVFAEAIAEVSDDVNVVYADHDVIQGDNIVADFKPDFDRVMLLSRDYITPVMAIRASAVGLHQLPTCRNDLYGLLLDMPVKSFHHIPDVLGRLVEQSPEQQAADAMQRQTVLESHFGDQISVTAKKDMPGMLVVTWNWWHRVSTAPLVNIIIPTLGDPWVLQPCVKTLLQHTDYPNYRVVILLNGARESVDLGTAEGDPRIEVVHYGDKPFNFAALNNWAVNEHTKEGYVLLLNDDINISSLDRKWLHSMMGHAVRPDVGAVGARLLFPSGHVQHVGVIVHRGVAGHLCKMLPVQNFGIWGRAVLSHESSAVTGACLLVSRDKYLEAGGLNEELSHNFNDVVLCMELRKLGYVNVVEATAEALHRESTSRPAANSPEGMERLQKEAGFLMARYHDPDPYWNKNLQFTSFAGGTMVQGTGFDMLAWVGTTISPHADRVLIINDTDGLANTAFDEIKKHNVVFVADISGFAFQMKAPQLVNMLPADIRQPNVMMKVLDTLRINRIIVRSLVGSQGAATMEALPVIARSHRPVEMRLSDLQAVCPRIDATRNGESCNAGWRNGADYCQMCIDQHGSPFGYVDVEAWRRAWGKLMPPDPSGTQMAAQ